jgi:hypothetical protein
MSMRELLLENKTIASTSTSDIDMYAGLSALELFAKALCIFFKIIAFAYQDLVRGDRYGRPRLRFCRYPN